jgi:putative transposase
VTQRRTLLPMFEKRDVPVTRACELLSISRRRRAYQAKKRDDVMVMKLKQLAERHPRWGVAQLHRKLLMAGDRVNLKRVRRLCKLHGLLLKQKIRKNRRGIGVGMPCKAEHPNHVWAYDFVEDRTENNHKLRILTVVDEFTRRCIEVEVEHRMNAKFVAWTLLKLFAEHGTPTFIRSDNGPEFIAKFLMNVMQLHGVSVRHIDPGSPWQNGIDERFNGTLRNECLNMETFHHRDHARAIVKLFKRLYNVERPHSSLGKGISPQMFYEQWQQANPGFVGHEASPHLGSAQTRDLSLCSPPTDVANEKGLIDAEAKPSQIDQPVSRNAILVTAPVASQQSRTLCEDDSSVSETTRAGTFPDQVQQHSRKT